MKRKTFIATILLCICCVTLSAQQKVSILGDSYSTFIGHLTPATNFCWYGGDDGGERAKNNDVKAVEQTWWHLLLNEMGYQLELNNSFSGATICHTGYRKEDYSDRAFITRMYNLGNPDIILIFGGTNDCWAKAPIGEYQHMNWTKSDLMAFRPAFCYLLRHIQMIYPDAEIYNITNSELTPEITNSMDEICRHYGITNILLHDIDKQWSHPSIKGMRAIADQVKAVLSK